jgi:hypothetical protein
MWEGGVEVLAVNNFCFSVRLNCAKTINLLLEKYVKTFLLAGQGHPLLADIGI